MAETTGIAWCDGTFNAWIGCTKIGRGCDSCYAWATDVRYHNGAHWGAGAPRYRTSESNWNHVLHWNKLRAEGKEFFPNRRAQVRVPLTVFGGSQMDFFDNEVDPQWRTDAWAMIRATPHLRWILVTKRIGNVANMLPKDWGACTIEGTHVYDHVGIILTVVDQEEFDRDVPKLAQAKVDYEIELVGLSIEPQLGPISFAGGYELVPDWVIVGGESRQVGAECREFDTMWALRLVIECGRFLIPLFVKQLGDRPTVEGSPMKLRAPAGKDPSEWPADLRVQQFPPLYDRNSERNRIRVPEPAMF